MIDEGRMMTKSLCLFLILAGATPAWADATHPAKISSTEMDAAFAGPKAVLADKKGVKTKWVEMLQSKDKKLSAGIYEATASRTAIDSYREDEFMYFIKGGVTLTSADGTVTEVKPGDGVTIQKGWKGVWETSGYTKYYVTYETAE